MTHIIVITAGNDAFTTNGQSHTLDVPAQIINGRTMLPVRAVLESVGYNFDWDSTTRTVLITDASLFVTIGNRQISTAEMSLSLSSSSLTNEDILPLRYMVNLTELNLSDNQISDISPIAGLANLTELRLDDNQIVDLAPLAGLADLNFISLLRNKIVDVTPLAGFTNSTELRITDNPIIDWSPLIYLDQFRLSIRNINSEAQAITGIDIPHGIDISCPITRDFIDNPLTGRLWDISGMVATRPRNSQPDTSAVNQIVLHQGTFTDSRGRTMELSYTMPLNVNSTTRLIFEIHGWAAGQGGGGYNTVGSDGWNARRLSAAANVIVISPHFTGPEFGDSNVFMWAGIPNNLHSPELWTCKLFDEIFEYYVSKYDWPVTSYMLIGHSGGGNLASRISMFSSSPYLDVVMPGLTNGGSYWPHYCFRRIEIADHSQFFRNRHNNHITGGRQGIAELVRYRGLIHQNLSRPTYFMLGDAEHGYIHARVFYSAWKYYAQAHDIPFGWNVVIMDGRGHQGDIGHQLDILEKHGVQLH